MLVGWIECLAAIARRVLGAEQETTPPAVPEAVPDASPPVHKIWYEYPEICLRGIRSVKDLSKKKNGSTEILLGAFEPDSRTLAARVSSGRSEHEEASVNWGDEPAAREVAFRDKAQSAAGLARVRVVELREQLSTPPYAALLPERDPKPNNPFHGNLLFEKGLTNQSKRMFQMLLAFHSDHIAREDAC